MDSEKSINSFDMKQKVSYMIIYWTIILFINFLKTFRHD